MEYFVYLNSNDSNALFPDNEVHKFKIHLKTPLILDGFWKIGLLEFDTRDSKRKSKTNSEQFLYLYSNICKDSIVKGEEKPLLRCLKKNVKDGWTYCFEHPIYLTVKRNLVTEMEFDIKDSNDEHASFLNEPVTLTLHLKQYPFYTQYESI